MSRWKYALEIAKVFIAYIFTLIAAALPMLLWAGIVRYFYLSSELLPTIVIGGLLFFPFILFSLALSQVTARAFIETWGRPYEP